MAELPHDRYYSRNPAALRGITIAMCGAGTIGSLTADMLARNGADLALFDRQKLEIENLGRHGADPKYLGMPKAEAVARTLRSRVPDEQRFRSAHVDLLSYDVERLSALLAQVGAAIVVGATGEDAVDLLLNRACGRVGLPLVVPGLYGAHEHMLGEVLFVPWSVDRVEYGCFECGRERAAAPDPLPAQPGPIDDALVIARLTATTTKAFLMPRSNEGQLLAQRVARGATLTFVERSGENVRYARPIRRRGCPACRGARTTTVHIIRQAVERVIADPPQQRATRNVPPVHVQRAEAAPPVAPPPRAAPPREQPVATRPADPVRRQARPRRAWGSSVVVGLFVLSGAWVATWAATCNAKANAAPGAACDADTPFDVISALRAKSDLSSSDPTKVIDSARRLLAADPKLNGWGAEAAAALRRILGAHPKVAERVVEIGKGLPTTERKKLANAFLADRVVEALGPELAVSFGLRLARTVELLDSQGTILLNLDQIGAALDSFEEALKKSSDMRIVAHWGYAAKLHALDVWDTQLGIAGHQALVEAISVLGEPYETKYAEALSWPVPVGGSW